MIQLNPAHGSAGVMDDTTAGVVRTYNLSVSRGELDIQRVATVRGRVATPGLFYAYYRSMIKQR